MRRLDEKIEEYTDYILYQKGKIAGQYGVGFLIKRHLRQYIQEIIGISDRLAILNVKLPNYKKTWSIIQVYAPTEQAEQSILDLFYEDLSLTIQKYMDNYIILMGDFNAQVGARLNPDEYTLGTFGHGKRSRNGQRLVEFLMEHNLVILNSIFKKKPNNKWTWMSPDGTYKNEIDYIITNHPKVFTDTNVITKLNFNTNHRMVRSSFKMAPEKLSRKHIKLNVHNQSRVTYNQSETDYQGIIKQINDTTDPIQKYEILEKHLKNYCTANKYQKTQKYQLSDETLQLIDKRKEYITQQSKKENIKKIAEISKKIKESIRKDRKTKRLKTLESHIQRTGGTKKALKELREAGKCWIPKLKRKGKPITNRTNIKELATHFFTQLYADQDKNTDKGTVNTHNLTTHITKTDPVPEILPCEVEKAIKSQKIEKSPGPDNISNELMKGTVAELTPILTNIFNSILTSGSIPKQWTKSHIILIHKKGDKEDIENYRPISLMSNVYKVLAKIILDRLSPILDEQQPVEQAGFRRGFSTIDHIHTVKQILEKYNEYNKNVYIAFIDYAKAFDSLSHNHIWDTLEHQGIPTIYTNIVKNIYAHSQASIQLETLGKDFPIRRGVRQGDPLSPKLFSAVLENIFRKLNWEDFGLNINGSKLNHLRFADDLILFEEKPDILEQMIQSLNEESEKVGLKMNLTKTKVMTNSIKVDITVSGAILEFVNEYTYLGQLISPKDITVKEINARIATGWKKFWSLKEIMKSQDLGIALKRKTFNTCILPCLTYGCETWALTNSLRDKLAKCQRAMERSIVGTKRRDRVRNTDIRMKTKLTDILLRVDQQKWRWTGHMMRDKHGKWCKAVSEWYPRDGKRSRGRQCIRWEDDIKMTAGPKWRRITQDRPQWKLLEEAYVKRHTEIRDIL
ncbi:unnamed protein product [Euphydryas editha]|uniref:Reverse transcriptase domain-containing protein n=1 Tax=Euphydryas editha TaxID=104508 RepID=A0AAU9UMB9_EUPED|nr:unnamed protein product [Euphydryas editha]